MYRIVLSIGCFFIASSALADQRPILDLEFGLSGKLEDRSNQRRSPQIGEVKQNGADEGVTLLAPDAIMFPYDEKDPLFGTGSFTFILKCRFSELDPFPSPSPVAGRWDAAENGRVIGFCFAPDVNPGMQFFVSSGGDKDSVFPALVNLLPADEWVILVGRFATGGALTQQIYSAGRELLEENRFPRPSPESLFSAPTPFMIGAPQSQRMGFLRLLVWDRSLSDDEVAEVLKKEFR